MRPRPTAAPMPSAAAMYLMSSMNARTDALS
jgi:hypothetical protein